jgi:hypothetical protein
MIMSTKIGELGLMWLTEHMVKAQEELKRTMDARAKTSNGTYGAQMDTLIAAKKEALSVWERHVALEQIAEDERKNA